MSLRVPAAVAVGLSLLVLPVIIVRAQAEGETEAPPATEEVVADSQPATTGAEEAATQEVEAPPAEQTPQESEAPTPTEQEGSVLGPETSTETASSSEVEQEPEASAVSSEASPTDESAATARDESASTTPPDFLPFDTASSTASSTEPVEDPPAVPYEEPFVLQPAVTLHQNGNSITADIQLENLTCKSCEKVLPAAQVKAYYTAWYPNDGEIKEVGDQVAEQAIEVSDVALWASRAMTWSATDIAPGKHYLVVVVDPENAIGAYRMQRMEFDI